MDFEITHKYSTITTIKHTLRIYSGGTWVEEIIVIQNQTDDKDKPTVFSFEKTPGCLERIDVTEEDLLALCEKVIWKSTLI